MNSFEENLAKLENLTANIRRNDISLEDALKDFEEGIKLASSLEKELEKIEGKIQILMNEPDTENKTTSPQLDLFSEEDLNNEPVIGTRK